MSDDTESPDHPPLIVEWEELVAKANLPDLELLEGENDDVIILRRSTLRPPRRRWVRTYAKEIVLGVITHSIAIWIGMLFH